MTPKEEKYFNFIINDMLNVSSVGAGVHKDLMRIRYPHTTRVYLLTSDFALYDSYNELMSGKSATDHSFIMNFTYHCKNRYGSKKEHREYLWDEYSERFTEIVMDWVRVHINDKSHAVISDE